MTNSLQPENPRTQPRKSTLRQCVSLISMVSQQLSPILSKLRKWCTLNYVPINKVTHFKIRVISARSEYHYNCICFKISNSTTTHKYNQMRDKMKMKKQGRSFIKFSSKNNRKQISMYSRMF